MVTITQPGTYRLTGTLSQGQIFVDLGEGAQDDPTAVVTLVLDSADVTCTVAPAIFFYRVYECGIADTASASPDVDTTAAGDTFTGYFVACLAAGTSPKECLDLATRASALAVSRPGAAPSIPTMEEVRSAQLTLRED